MSAGPAAGGDGARGRAAPDPIATYRVQLTPAFDLDAAADLVPYLARLGISHLYLSPVFEAVPGSAHGYDGVDPTRVRGELGGRPALDRLRVALDQHDLGLLLDVVPNHLATHHTNPWWWSLLAEGRDGPGGATFDVDWDGGAHRPPGTVLVPVLGAPLDEVLARGELSVVGAEHGPELRYFEHRFPLAPGTAPAGGVAAGDEARLREVLAAQRYRLAHWRVAATEVGYRRFFDITSLIGVRVEDPHVFSAAHALVGELVEQGVVQGLRVDHVDGLADPAGYLDDLAARTDRTWVVVEKVLGHDERLPGEWAVDGTTGYEVAELVSRALVDHGGEAALVALHQRVAGGPASWAEVVAEAKAEVLDRLFAAELGRVAALLTRALGGPPGQGPDEAELVAGLRALVLGFDVYRPYPPPAGPLGIEASLRLRRAADRARAAAPEAVSAVDRIEALLLAGEGGEAGLEARTRLAQLTGPVMAKGVEDTALYRWIPLVSAGDVGAEPSPLGLPGGVDAFHKRACALAAWPRSLSATSTHDSKRSEDVRARLHVLSELPDRWAEVVDRWSAAVDPVGTAVDGRARLLLWQTLVGAWPVSEPRVRDHLRKANREAKLRTSWTDPDRAYEAEVDRLVERVFADEVLLASIAAFVAELEAAGRTNALVQVLLKVALPGVPDVYQGNEVWRHDLTDPDNRRTVDVDRRRSLLAWVADPTVGPADVWPEGDVADPGRAGAAKLWLLHRTLAVRHARPAAFAGGYQPLRAEGAAAEHVLAFARGDDVVVVVPRLTVRLAVAGGWRGTTLALPAGRWHDALVGGEHRGAVEVADLLSAFPAALLVRA